MDADITLCGSTDRGLKTTVKTIISALTKQRAAICEIPGLICFVCLLMAAVFVTPVAEQTIGEVYGWGEPTPTMTQLFLGPTYAYVAIYGVVISALLASDRMVASPSARMWTNLAGRWVGLVLCVVYALAMLYPFTRMANKLGG